MYNLIMVPVELAVRSANLLGETPLWDYRSGVLVWVDIDAGEICLFEPRSGSFIRNQPGQMVTALGLRAAGGYVAAVKNGFAMYDPADNSISKTIQLIEDNDDTRFNDGAVDPLGRFWAGVYSSQHKPASGLYCLRGDWTASQVETDLIASNGLGWSPDRKRMYHTDTGRKTIYQYDFDPQTGSAQNRRPLIVVPDEPDEGSPDGLAVDTQGNIWSARYRGGKVVCYDPYGRLQMNLAVPTLNVTSCAFGGIDLDHLYITTAREKKDQPPVDDLEGSLFIALPGARGQPAYQYSG